MLKETDLLAYGYLPKQLPPPFYSTKWSDAVKKYSIKPASMHPETMLVRISVPRPRGLPRILGIPHPGHFHALAKLVADNWIALSNICNSSRISLSTPRLGDQAKGERALEARDGSLKYPQAALKRRAGRRYMLKADISQCYPSIYTHALCWAIQGQSAAKAATKTKPFVAHYSDAIDKTIRDAQERQSVGLPIGPDTSFLMANVLLSKIDKCLQTKIPNLAGTRQIDDYELYFDTIAEAEVARTTLAQCLASFKLALNPGKTRVVTLPDAIEPDWKHELSNLNLGGNPKRVGKRLRAAADYSFTKRQNDDGSRAITYLLTVLSNCAFHPDIWPLAQSIALASLEFEENSLPRAAKMFITAHGKGWAIDKPGVSGLLNRMIVRNSKLGHGQVVAWALWLMIVLDLTVSIEAVREVATAQDPIALIVLAHGKHTGVVAGFKLNAVAKALGMLECWNCEHWLFLYECIQHNWVGPKTKKLLEATLKTQPYLAALNKRKVSFYDIASGTIKHVKGNIHIILKHPNAHAWAQIELPPDYIE